MHTHTKHTNTQETQNIDKDTDKIHTKNTQTYTHKIHKHTNTLETQNTDKYTDKIHT